MAGFDHDFANYPRPSIYQEVSDLADGSIAGFDFISFYNPCAAKM